MAFPGLIIVEGLPGSGKSTTAKLIFDLLIEQGGKPRLFLEGDVAHPADYDSWSYFPSDGFAELLQTWPEQKLVLEKTAIEHMGGYLLPRFDFPEKGIALPDELAERLFEQDIYELDFEQHVGLLLERWQRFAETAVSSEETFIFECCFIQNPVTIGTVKNGLPDEAVKGYIQKLAAIIEPLNPVLLYVEQADFRNSFMKAASERQKSWLDGFIDYYTTQGYGQVIQAKGLPGTLDVLEKRQKLETGIFEELAMEKYRVDNTSFDMEKHKKELADILNPLAESPLL